MGVPLSVLLVEDSLADAELVLIELRAGGYDPDYQRVDTPEEMKAALERREWNAILCDYVMPRFSGPAALKLYQSLGLDVPFIMVTGQVGEETAVEAMKAGANDYVLKINLTRLVPAIQRELRDAEVRRQRRQAEEDRDRLVARLREVNASLAVSIIAAKEAVEREQAIREELSHAHERLEKLVEERTRELAGERERRLQETEAQRRFLQTVIDNAPVGIALLRGPEFIFELANPAYQSIVPGKVLIGRTVAESWPELASEIVPLLDRVFHTGEPYRTVDSPYPVQRMPGAPLEEVYFTFSYVPLFEHAGEVESILVLVIETTEQVHDRQRTEQLAREAQRRSAELQSIIDNMVDGVFVSDAEGRITLVNEAGVHMLGMDQPEEAKRDLAEFPELLRVRHPDGKSFGPEELPLGRALRGETVVQDDQIIHNPKTRRDVYLRISAAPIREEAGEIAGAVAVVRDVTELMELDRLKDQFISVAAHELKTPVTIMKGYAQILERNKGVPAEQRKLLDAINRGADRINRIVKDLLDISQLHIGELEMTYETIDLRQLVKESVDRVGATTAIHRIRVVKSERAIVRGNMDRLEQVLTNLLDNAIKYSPRGGDIDVGVEVRDHEGVVSVRDHGVGIPKEKQEQIFEQFYSAHAGTPYDYGGMGVGLYISKEIIQRHGGRMWFESEEDKGSAFHFSLPLSPST